MENHQELVIGDKYKWVAVFKHDEYGATREVFAWEQILGEHGWYRDNTCAENERFDAHKDYLHARGFKISEWLKIPA